MKSYSFLKRRVEGFSLTELMIGMVFSLLLFGFAYRFFVAHVTTQYREDGIQRIGQQIQEGIERIRRDLSAIDYNWTSRDVIPISYQAAADHPGEAGDWLTFVVPDLSYLDPIQFVSDVTTIELFDSAGYLPIKEVDDSSALSNGDWVVIYQTGQYQLAQISDKDTTTQPGKISGLTFEWVDVDSVAGAGQPGVVPLRPTPPDTFSARETIIQKVQPITYRLVTRGTDNKSYLARITKGNEALVARADDLRFAFDEKVGADVVADTRSVTDWMSVIAVKIEATSIIGTRRNDLVAKVSLPGGFSEPAESVGEVGVVPTCEVSTKSVGQLAVETYPDGETRMVIPSTDFVDAATSSGEIAIVNGATGEPIGSSIVTEYLGRPFLPTSVARFNDPSLGMIAGGYWEDASGVVTPVLVYLHRNSTTGKMDPTTVGPIYTAFTTPPAGLRDTVSVTTMGRYVYLSSYAKESNAAPVRIFRTQLANGSFATPVEVFSDSDAADRLISAISQGPNDHNDQPTLAFCKTNSLGMSDGLVGAVTLDSSTGSFSGSVTTIARTDWQCSGLQADDVALYIGGRLDVKSVSLTQFHELTRGSVTASPVALNLDNKMLSDGSNRYYDEYQVSNVEPGAPCSSQTIRHVGGFGITRVSSRETRLALANNESLSGGTTNASLSTIRMAGPTRTQDIAATKPDATNLNLTPVRVASVFAFHALPIANFPPGVAVASGGIPDRIDPTPPHTCDFDSGNGSAALECLGGKINGPTFEPIVIADIGDDPVVDPVDEPLDPLNPDDPVDDPTVTSDPSDDPADTGGGSPGGGSNGGSDDEGPVNVQLKAAQTGN